MHLRALFVLLLVVIPFNTTAQSFININAGEIGIDTVHQQSRIGIEYRHSALSKLKLIPAFGIVRNENKSKYIYTTIMHDFHLSPSWILSPSFGVTLFDNSHDIDLGTSIEYRTGLEIAYRLINSYRIGVSAYHLSNGGTSNRNPGTESVVVSLSIPL